MHKGGEVRGTRRLLHVVGDDQDRDLLLELGDQFLDGRGGDRVERRGRFVEQQDFGIGGERARDAQALLLAAGQVEGQVVQAVLDLVPQRRAAQRLLDLVVHVAATLHDAAHAQAVGDVLVDGFGKRVGFWNTMEMRMRTSIGSTFAPRMLMLSG